MRALYIKPGRGPYVFQECLLECNKIGMIDIYHPCGGGVLVCMWVLGSFSHSKCINTPYSRWMELVIPDNSPSYENSPSLWMSAHAKSLRRLHLPARPPNIFFASSRCFVLNTNDGCSRKECIFFIILPISWTWAPFWPKKWFTLFRHFAINACLAPLYSLEGLHIITVEGIGDHQRGLHPVQVMHCFCKYDRNYFRCQYDHNWGRR
jgi:hypothetical protein